MSDQHMNAGDQGTQPDSGSAPNDQVTTSAAGGGPQGAPRSHGSAPAGHEATGSGKGGSGESKDTGTDGERDVTMETHRKGQ